MNIDDCQTSTKLFFVGIKAKQMNEAQHIFSGKPRLQLSELISSLQAGKYCINPGLISCLALQKEKMNIYSTIVRQSCEKRLFLSLCLSCSFSYPFSVLGELTLSHLVLSFYRSRPAPARLTFYLSPFLGPAASSPLKSDRR